MDILLGLKPLRGAVRAAVWEPSLGISIISLARSNLDSCLLEDTTSSAKKVHTRSAAWFPLLAKSSGCAALICASLPGAFGSVLSVAGLGS